MAQFRAVVKGSRGPTSRLGSKRSGIVAEVNGWTLGVTVYAVHVNGKDRFEVWQTDGSKGTDARLVQVIEEGGAS